MSSQIVFKKLHSHYQATGKIMQKEQFVEEIARQFPQKDVIEGLMVFNNFLDESRKKRRGFYGNAV